MTGTMAAVTASLITTVTFINILLFGFVIFMFSFLIALRLLIARHEDRLEKKKERIRPIVHELLASDDDVATAIANRLKLLSGERDAFEQVLLENARVLRGREMSVLTQVFEIFGFVSEDIRNLRTSRNLKKAKSAYHLGVMKASRATPFLLEFLSSDSPEVVFSCLNALSHIGTPEAIQGVMDYLYTTDEPWTLRVAEVLLERKQAFAPHIRGWLESGVTEIQKQVFLIDICGVIRDVSAVPLLISRLEHSDEDVRAHSARALGLIGDFNACLPLVAAIDDSEPLVRAEAAVAAGNIHCTVAIPRLQECLQDQVLEVKISSAVALTKMGEAARTALEEGLVAAE